MTVQVVPFFSSHHHHLCFDTLELINFVALSLMGLNRASSSNVRAYLNHFLATDKQEYYRTRYLFDPAQRQLANSSVIITHLNKLTAPLVCFSFLRFVSQAKPWRPTDSFEEQLWLTTAYVPLQIPHHSPNDRPTVTGDGRSRNVVSMVPA
jgi:hypothetical protein